MTTTTTPADLPRNADYQGRDKAALAVIRFFAGYVAVQKRPRVIDGVRCTFRGHEMYDYVEGETALECAQRVARRFVANLGGEVAVEGKLRRVQGGCELPTARDAAFGWTRETRGVGEVSIIPDVFLIF